jgi:hypothetical protein
MKTCAVLCFVLTSVAVVGCSDRGAPPVVQQTEEGVTTYGTNARCSYKLSAPYTYGGLNPESSFCSGESLGDGGVHHFVICSLNCSAPGSGNGVAWCDSPWGKTVNGACPLSNPIVPFTVQFRVNHDCQFGQDVMAICGTQSFGNESCGTPASGGVDEYVAACQ